MTSFPPFDFYDSGLGDTGEPGEESATAGIANKEALNETTLNRSPKNLWNRTEVLKEWLDEYAVAMHHNFGFTIMCDPDTTVSFLDNGSSAYYFTVSDTIYLSPMNSLSGDPTGTGGSPVYARLYINDTGVTTEVQIEADHSISLEDSNNLYLRIWVGAGSAGPITTVEPAGATTATLAEGPVVLAVELNFGGNTWASIIASILADQPAFVSTASYTKVVSGTGSRTTDYARVRFRDGDTGSAGGVGIEAHKIAAATFASFFDVGGTPNTMSEGDILVIDYATFTARFAEDATAGIASGDLQIVGSDDIDGGINHSKRTTVPIAKIFNDNLYFMNGAVFKEDQTGRLLMDTSTRENMPFLTVGADLGADYQTITAAFDALDTAGTGGTIYVQQGTYIEDISITGTDGNVRVIAEGHVTLQPSSGAVITTSGAMDRLLSFEGFRIDAGTQQAVSATNTNGATLIYGRLQFVDCIFESSATSSINFIDVDTMDCILVRCRLVQTTSHTADVTAIYVTQSLAVTTRRHLRVESCIISGFATVVDVATAASSFETIKFKNNYMSSVGHSPNGGTAGVLINVSENFDVLEITDNYVEANGTSTNSALFVTVANIMAGNEVVDISRNKILNALDEDPGTSVVYMISTGTPLTTYAGLTRVQDNVINCGYAGGVKTSPGEVLTNTCYGANPQNINQFLVYSESSVPDVPHIISGNKVVLTSGAVAGITAIRIHSGAGTHSDCSNNIVDMSRSTAINHTGVQVDAARCTVLGNQVIFEGTAAGTKGIVLATGGSARVVGNMIYDAEICINVDSEQSAVSANHLVCYAAASPCVCINVTGSGDRNAITGNFCNKGEFSIVLAVGANNNCVMGNQFLGYLTTAYSDDGTNNGANLVGTSGSWSMDFNYDSGF